jgi:hypothetical protein
MNAIVANILMREAAKAHTDASPFKVAVLFCCVGLLASLSIVSLGFEIATGFLFF